MTVYGDVLQAVARGNDYQGKDFSNVFYYLYEGAEHGSNLDVGILAESIGLNVLPWVRQLMHTSTIFSEVSVINLFNQTEFATELVNLAGTVTGQSAPSFLAAGFRSGRTRRDIRRGYKRFGPISEDVTAGNSYDPIFTSAIEGIEGALGALQIDADGEFTMTPIVVKRLAETQPDGTVTYRLPTSQSELAYSSATVWDFYGITTQSSRK